MFKGSSSLFWILFFNLSLVLVCLSPADPPV
uniref:Uncharacterized protein n=1 Tax=Anguilla anguilla TaxID=7936 RepID=A0A0E9S3T3_ANGAN